MDPKKEGLTLRIANRLQGIEGSPTLALSAKAKALTKAGKDVLDLTAGEPDFPTPAHVKAAGVRAIENNQTRYTPVAGISELRSAIAETLNRQHQTAYAPAQILVSCGAKHSLFNVFQTLLQAPDEVLILAPYWVSYPPLVQLSGARPVIIPTTEQDQFLPNASALRAAVTAQTRAIILNSPSNPTGAVMDQKRLSEIAQLAIEKDLIIVSDEIYDQLVYPPQKHYSIIQVAPKVIDRTVLVGGVSKTYSMTGWRIGFAAGPQAWMDTMTTLQSHSTSNAPSISQHAALEALAGPQNEVSKMRENFQKRRDVLVNGLNLLSPLRCQSPGGAFYAWCNVSGLGKSADTIASLWLEEALIAVIPSEGFGMEGYVRMSFAASLETIEATLKRLEQWLKQR
ncbi:MAG: pyridoxal phosphate-dependent aminotransferase [Candidatus Omnitrophica bacterium]|nr:pyridoxal phosphate-dependent aminotransferase [Candidatus Omnitrophota bacterium]